ncbi:phage Gp37/Gp68 family protein [Methylobacterium sp.]|uniref:phage Gp37/Gp68 family protein n=1 Tax=Methylobacterium sp. TaxID=409 RepID=UPI0025D1C985|nr:phage Gp37/Gp68 family protein [Methylobacterium sp.]MBY0256214.1 phage Gp37/Gp68 family protein [Methylobacterium sp.]
MAEHSTIEWTDATWNPITGCSIVSPGCTNCYAMGLAGTRLKHHPSRAGLTVDTKAGPVWNGQVRLNGEWLTQPIEWKRPRRVFVCAHGDLFAESVPDSWIDRVFAVMALAPHHAFQVLTKRSARMRAYLSDPETPARVALLRVLASGKPGEPTPVYVQVNVHSEQRRWPLPNVWLGVSAEDQRRANERLPDLLATPAAVRFVSAEPLLGPIDFTAIPDPDTGSAEPWPHAVDALTGDVSDDANGIIDGVYEPGQAPKLNWIIVGGESGPGARPMHPTWARSIREQCEAADVAFHFKQWGAWHPWGQPLADGSVNLRSFGKDPEHYRHLPGQEIVSRVGKKAAGRLLDGVEHNGMPESAR